MRRNKVFGIGAAALALGLTMTACGTTKDDPKAGSGDDCSVKLAFIGPLTGDYANLGINILNGADLALKEYKGDCKVEIVKKDSQGDPEKAKPFALEIAKDKDIIGVIGPTFSGETEATGPTFADPEVGLVTLSASATNPDLSSNGWNTFHRLIGTDAVQAPAAAKFITDTLKAKKVMVIDDASEYGVGLANGLKKALGSVVTETDTVQQKQSDFSATVTKAKASGTDAIYYAGYYAEAGKLAKQLKQGGYEGTFVSGDGSLDPGFIEAGGDGAEGAYLTCPCLWGTGDWAAKYEKEIGQAPGTYSTEGYDVMNVFLNGIEAGKTTRADMLKWVTDYDEDGLTKHISFDDKGDVEESSVYAYEIKDGEIQPGQTIE
ncbi:branched-chain amino acid ABC transporter substrate-binding protein [Pimelobacter simplex]|uniref:branched-chain amino acid ABC transporter substrate-binding protein n=1 Tax=Nocardioides simplex TaxID=2045 RepID=UPI00214FF67D|nr:branched-chain amino acid ABC transporter substrate-binding protein [Pimelobacter simplex]UUW87664.1 branched-chain amino acid ABC transporter substrate-binding protein [Pimelobacter simplex]UUW97170.1 branched-chain amino acid ABC transporter substrate-binding protein [Pimelobacter simplex]